MPIALEAVTSTTIISTITELVTASVQWIGQGVSAITGNPLLMVMFLFGMVSVGIGLVRRFF